MTLKNQFVLNECRYEAPFAAHIDAVVGVARSDAATMTSTIAALDNVRVSELSVYLTPAPSPTAPPPHPSVSVT